MKTVVCQFFKMSSDICIECNLAVRPRQQGLQCDGCSRWQHRKCSTGVSQADYRTAIKERRNIEWSCSDCSTHTNDVDSIPNVSTTVETSRPESTSFNIDRSFVHEQPAAETSIDADVLISAVEISHEQEPLGYQIVENRTKRGKRMLVDDDGHSFTIKKQKNDNTLWRCTKRSKDLNCPATVIQQGDSYTKGQKAHSHAAQPGKLLAVKIKAQAKENAHKLIFEKPAPRLVEEAFRDHADTLAPEASRPNPAHLVRAINRIRQNLRPHDLVDLQFELDSTFLEENAPNFFQHDVEVNNRRHLIFYTNRQLDLLAKAKTWYMDGTFKIVNKPWIQLFSIHSFIKSDKNVKQVPLVFCFMSGRSKDDYYAVLRAIDRQLPEQIALRKFVMDFEIAMWQAVRKRFDDIPVQGCAFHWAQAVYRKVQAVGLQTEYNNRDEVHSFLRKVMALPFLPPEHITDAFTKLQRRVDHSSIETVMTYVQETWIDSSTFRLECWSVYLSSVRTNNDVEGWHNRLNSKVNSRGRVPFYLLIGELYKEATSIPIMMKLLSENKLQRRQRKDVNKIQGKLFKLWEDYAKGDISTSKLLEKCSGVYAPCI